MNKCPHRSVLALCLIALLSIGTLATAIAAEPVPVTEELQRLAKEHGFAVTGLELTEGAVARAEGDGLYRKLRHLLENFDHAIVQGDAGGVERVIVLGVKDPGSAGSAPEAAPTPVSSLLPPPPPPPPPAPAPSMSGGGANPPGR